ncbi:MAG: hypothetical protein R3E61_08700 [Pseudomonadales bacterium]
MQNSVLKIPFFATLGAGLPSISIKQAKLRPAWRSFGMLCAEQELGLAEVAMGCGSCLRMRRVGVCIRYLQLDDSVVEVDLTPNRGDCLGMVGLAREVAALTGSSIKSFKINEIEAKVDARTSVNLKSPEHCARYVGRVIRNINTGSVTPLWMAERLRRADCA